MKFYNKIKWILGISVIFLLIIITNLIDKNNFSRVKESVSTIYEDRIVANDLIFEMFKSIHDKEIAVISSDTLFFSERNKEENVKIKGFLARYEQTELTKEESSLLNQFKENLNSLKTLELNYIDFKENDKKLYLDIINQIRKDLYNLSKIQLKEGKRQMFISQKAINTIDLFTQIEIYFLIFLAIVIQIIVMYNPQE